MTTINNIGASDPVQRLINRPIQKSVTSDGTDSSIVPAKSDRLDLSGVNGVLQSLQSNNVRADKVASVRAQIEAGTYEDDNKLNVTVDKVLEDLSN